MKAKELMIGDWFHFKYPNGIMQIKSFKDFIGIEEDEDNVEPIPLSEDILNVNKLSYKKVYKNYECYEIRIDSYSTWFALSIIETDDGAYSWSIEDMPIHYVHELQHAMRLIGLNEMADNFKIE